MPGASLAVVRGGEVLFTEGMGVHDLDTNAPATTDTLYPIGSATKPLIGLLLASLVDEGLLGWDDRVRKWLPDFRLWSPLAGEHATLRDLLCHRSGLSRHLLATFFDAPTARELLRRLPHLPPHDGALGFREGMQYNEHAFVIAAAIVEAVDGVSWQSSLRRRVLDPLAVRGVNLRPAPTPETATGYVLAGGAASPVQLRVPEVMAPARGVSVSAEGMARLLVGLTTPGRCCSERGLDELVRPHLLTGGKPPHPSCGHWMYGLGHTLLDYRGRLLAGHIGHVPGFRCWVGYSREDAVGVAILTNAIERNPLPVYLGFRLYDLVAGLPDIDWLREHRTMKRWLASPPPEPLTPCSVDYGPSAPFAGTFTNTGYGSLRLEGHERALSARANGESIALLRLDRRTWAFPRAPGLEAGGARLEFDGDEAPQALTLVAAIDGESRTEFERTS